MGKIALWAVGVPLALYVFACVLLYATQRNYLYFPGPRHNTRVDAMPLRVPDATLVVSRREVADPRVVVYFGGNAEDVSVSLPGLVAAFPDRAIYAMHYRGFGGSTGSPSETALVADGLALVDEVRRTHPQVTVIGRSLGSGVAVQVAAQRRLERLVLVTPYDSIVAVAGVHFAWFPVDWIVRDRFESVLRAPALTVPTTVIAADGDTVIPRVHTQRLLAAFRAGVARYVEVPDSNHDSISDRPQYVDALREAVR